jgi:hypothetical protein
LNTLYATLGVRPTATKREITSAFRVLALRHHPDRSRDANAVELFVAVRAAYEILADDRKRSEYDRMLVHEATRSSTQAEAGPEEQARQAAAATYGRWQADARRRAEQEANLSYIDFVQTALVSAVKFGGGAAIALVAGAMEGAIELVLRLLVLIAVAIPVIALLLSYTTHRAFLLVTVPLGIGWWAWLVHLQDEDPWTWKSALVFIGAFVAYCGLCLAIFKA